MRLVCSLCLTVCFGFALPVSAQQLFTHPQGDADLGEKWRWAMDQLRDDSGRGWIAYQFAASFDERLNPVAAVNDDGFVQWSGRSPRRGSGVTGYRWPRPWSPGASINSLQTSRASNVEQTFIREQELLLVAHIVADTVQTVELVDPASPINWQDEPVYWLEAADGTDSFAHLSDLLEAGQSLPVQRGLARIIGLHDAQNRLSYLWSVYDARQREAITPWLVESLALDGSSAATPLLMEVALDQNAQLSARRVAISALSRHRDAQVEQALASLADPLNPTPIRLEAIESLGFFTSAATAELLQNIASGKSSDAILKRAIHSLVWMPGAYALLVDHSRNHPSREIRQEALQLLRAVDAEAATADLAWLVENDADQRVRRAAIEELDEGAAEQVVPILFAVIDNVSGQALRVRCEAVESLGEFDRQDVMQRLEQLAWLEHDDCIPEEALDSLADLDTPRAHALLLDIAQNHPRRDSRDDALDHLQDHFFQRNGI